MRFFIPLLFLISFTSALEAKGDYLKYDQWEKKLKAFSKSPLVSLQKLGKTAQGRNLYLLSIKNKKGIDKKPAIYLQAGLDSHSFFSTRVLFLIAKKLLANPLLKRVDLYFVFLANPDGRSAALKGGSIYPPGNLTPWDDDGDHKKDEDPPEDLNGDGWITEMALPSPEGEWKWKKGGKILVKISSKEVFQGIRYHRYMEGRDNDHDGKYNEDGPGGIDFGAHFPSQWDESRKGAGLFPLSEPAPKAIVDFITGHPEIFFAINLTTGGTRGIYLPYGKKKLLSISSGDRVYYQKIIDKATSTTRWPLGAGRAGKVGKSDTRGSFVEWCYHRKGIYALDFSLWGTPTSGIVKGFKLPPKKKLSSEEKWLLFCQKIRRGFSPWKEVSFPKLGRVFIGGFHRNFLLNPPAFLAKKLEEKSTLALVRCLEGLTSLLPNVSIKVEGSYLQKPQGNTALYSIKASVLNSGALPLKSARAFVVQEAILPRLVLKTASRICLGNKEYTLRPLVPRKIQKKSWVLFLKKSNGGGSVNLRIRGRKIHGGGTWVSWVNCKRIPMEKNKKKEE